MKLQSFPFAKKSASRALGVLTVKFKQLDEMPFYVYTKLFGSLVCSVVAATYSLTVKTGVKFVFSC